MRDNQHHIDNTDEAWNDGLLGADEEFVAITKKEEIQDTINEALGLQPISIRLHKNLIEDLKMIAKLNGLGYQPLVRQILTRFVDCEKRKHLREAMENQIQSGIQIEAETEEQQKQRFA